MQTPSDERLTLERYSFSEVSRLLKVPANTVSNWFRGYRRGDRVIDAMIARPDAKPRVSGRISFLELAEAKVASACRERGIAAFRIRRAREFSRLHLDIEYPFATRRFVTDGSRILYEFEQAERDKPDGPMFVDIGDSAGQTTLPGYIEEVIGLFEFASEDGSWPTSFFPRGVDVPLSVDPTFRGGQLTIVNRGITPQMVWGRWKAGEALGFIARDLRLTTDEVSAAIDYCESM